MNVLEKSLFAVSKARHDSFKMKVVDKRFIEGTYTNEAMTTSSVSVASGCR